MIEVMVRDLMGESPAPPARPSRNVRKDGVKSKCNALAR
jgi:hypothetical protein